MNQAAESSAAKNVPKIIYILYLASIVLGVTSIVGVIMAYIYKKDAPQWVQSHYRFLIRTFWIGLLYSVIGIILSFVIIGYLILLFVLVWLIIRCIKGLQSLEKQEAYPNPQSWMFG